MTSGDIVAASPSFLGLFSLFGLLCSLAAFVAICLS
jgi:hypothetical protein